MRSIRSRAIALALLTLLACSACGGESSGERKLRNKYGDSPPTGVCVSYIRGFIEGVFTGVTDEDVESFFSERCSEDEIRTQRLATVESVWRQEFTSDLRIQTCDTFREYPRRIFEGFVESFDLVGLEFSDFREFLESEC